MTPKEAWKTDRKKNWAPQIDTYIYIHIYIDTYIHTYIHFAELHKKKL